ncbi:MAG: 6-phosphofructokinase [Planctomycetota bacterium]|jgi:6-phosphofructokinase 1
MADAPKANAVVLHAVVGMSKGQFIDLKKVSADTLEQIAASPCSTLGSSRDKPDEEYCQKILEVFKKHNIRYFFYIGGNDSANTAHIINKMATEAGYELRAFHIPKTVDNDLLITDHCPGFGTAAKFEACALIGDDLDNRTLPGIKIDVIMGVYVPERPVSMDKFLSDVDSVLKKLGRCVITASEGIRDADGVTWAKKLVEQAEKDAHGNIQLSGTGALADFLAGQAKTKLGAKRVRADTFGYLQRSFPGLQSEVDAREARWCGRHAVQYAMEEVSGSVAIKRVGNGANYAVELFRTDLSNVAEKTKHMPDEFINAEGNGVTDAFIEYAMPLTGGLPKTEHLGNYPRI